MKIKNIYKDYAKDETLSFASSITYKKVDYTSNTIDTLKLSITEESYIDWLEADNKNFYVLIESDGTSLPLEAEIEDYLEDNYAKTDLSLFKLLSNTRNYKPNIFTSSNKIKDNHGTHLIASITLPAIDKFIILKGKHSGYILIKENYKEVHIFKRKYVYTLNFTIKKESKIIKLINTLIIE